MGMTIDEAVEDYEDMKKGWYLIHPEKLFDFTIEIMRKYQKIEQIVNSNPDYIHHTDMDTYKLNSIREVLEDGNEKVRTYEEKDSAIMQ